MSLNERDQQIKDAALELCKYDGIMPHIAGAIPSAKREIERFLFILELAQKIK